MGLDRKIEEKGQGSRQVEPLPVGASLHTALSAVKPLDTGAVPAAPGAPAGEPSNQERVGWAKAALEGFTQAMDPESHGFCLDEATTDLLAGLMHLADARGFDFNECLRVARSNHHHDARQESFCAISGERRQELADEAYCGLHPRLWEVMKDAGQPQWRTEGVTATDAAAREWMALLSDPQIREALGGWDGSNTERYLTEVQLRANLMGELQAKDLSVIGRKAAEEILGHIHGDLDPEVIAIGYERDIWQNDDQTAIEVAQLAIGFKDDETPGGIYWCEWDSVKSLKGQEKLQEILKDIGGWLIDSYNHSITITLQ